MSRFLKKINIIVRRRSRRLPLLLMGALVILLLSVNEETSCTRNMAYDNEIRELKREIALTNDSAAYYRQKRLGIMLDAEGLEHVAREQYHMQRPTEDVFIVKEND